MNKLHLGNCLEVLKTIADCSIDSIVTDPPYELGFMGKGWDKSGIANDPDVWRECLRVLKPGGHLLAFSGSRTYHRMTCAIEDAGFDVRDQIMWLYGSGFPKSLDVSKAIDKAAGATREVTGVAGRSGSARSCMSGDFTGGEYMATAPATESAQQWQGWGTALKPAHEPICVARKRPIGTVAANVLAHGTGALNIDGCRVPSGQDHADKCASVVGIASDRSGAVFNGLKDARTDSYNAAGRWPANFIHDGLSEEWAKFFYCAKASRKDRNEGCEAFDKKPLNWSAGTQNPGSFQSEGTDKSSQNNHPTVKPTELMRYLCRLVTPPGGVVLDPFMGSGSTGKAAVLEGFRFVGIDMTPEYVEIARARIAHAAGKIRDSHVCGDVEKSSRVETASAKWAADGNQIELF